jgi:hypothetical protein
MKKFTCFLILTVPEKLVAALKKANILQFKFIDRRKKFHSLKILLNNDKKRLWMIDQAIVN